MWTCTKVYTDVYIYVQCMQHALYIPATRGTSVDRTGRARVLERHCSARVRPAWPMGAAARKPLSIAAHGHAHARKSKWGQITPHFILVVLAAEAAGGALGTMPDPAQLPSMPVFSVTPSLATGLDLLGAAVTAPQTEGGSRTPGQLTTARDIGRSVQPCRLTTSQGGQKDSEPRVRRDVGAYGRHLGG